MLSPDKFQVNEAWIALRVNEDFLFVKDDPYNVYVLMDAASTYVFGHVLSPVRDKAPSRKEVEALFKKAWQGKRQWAQKLIVTEESKADNLFREVAEKNGLSSEIIPLSELEPIVGPLKESFNSRFFS